MSAQLKPIDEDQDNFREWAREALEKTDGDFTRAKALLVDRVMENRALLNKNLCRIVGVWANSEIHQVMKDRRQQRSPVESSAQVVAIDGGAFNKAVMANYERYMLRPVWGGKPVGQCTADELRASADLYTKHGSVMLREATWEIAVAEALEKNRESSTSTVRDALPETTLAKLWESMDE